MKPHNEKLKICIGIDACKTTLDLHFRADGRILSVADTCDRPEQISPLLSGYGVSLVLFESAGGYGSFALTAAKSVYFPV